MDRKFKEGSFLDSYYKMHQYSKSLIFSVVEGECCKEVDNRELHRIEPYEPAMFIYSYFCFNTLYNINWEKTCNSSDNKAVTYVKDNKRERTSDSTKVNNFLKFLTNCDKEDNIKRKEIFADTLIDFLLSYCERKNHNRNGFFSKNAQKSVNDRDFVVSWMEEMLKGFRPECDFETGDECQIYRNDIETFINTLLYLLKDDKEASFTEGRILKSIEPIIYKVRCNLFHGAKDFRNFNELYQLERFAIYAGIITALNEVLFYIASTKITAKA